MNSRQYRLANDGNPEDHSATETEFIPKVALAWSLSDDNMVYGLYTRGIRPGGINRSRGDPFFSNSYTSDLMDNYEIGYRSSFGEGRGRFNVTGYHMQWTDFQLEIVDPTGITDCPDPGPSSIPGVCGQPWQQVVTNAKAMANVMMERDYRVVSGGTDNHLFLVDLIGNDYTGKDAEEALGRASITVNKNTVPGEPRSPFVTSGLRLGTPAVTTRGFDADDCVELAGIICDVLDNIGDSRVEDKARESAVTLCRNYPVYRH